MRYIPAICIGIMLVLTYYLYSAAYLSTDDFNNLYWAQRQTGLQTIEQLVNPASRAVRPAGMMFYWVLFNIFHVNAAPYHWIAWLLHAVNTWLVYLVLKRITASHPGSVIGAMLFACQAAFADIYWNFGSIFELLSALGFFLGVLWWLKEPRSWKTVLACTVLFFFTLKAKEMAITLPAIWLLCDLLIQKKPSLKTASYVLPPAALGIWFGLRKVEELGSSDPTDLHYMDLQWITLGRGLGIFFNQLFTVTLRWQFWAIGFAFVGCAVLPVLCLATYLVQLRDSEELRMWLQPMSLDYRAFVSELRSLPVPDANEILYFDSHPIHFSPEHLRSATGVALGRTDIEVQLVSTFPPEARYKLHYEKQRLTQVP